MGLSSKKTTTTNKPVYAAEVEGANAITNQTYQDNKGTAADLSSQFADLVPNLLSKYNDGDSMLNSAKSYNQDVTDGVYLDQGNPYLQSQIDATNASVRDATNAAIGTRGQTGGSAQYNLVSQNLAANESGLRYADYNSERDRMAQAVNSASGLMSAEQIPLAAAMAAGESAVNLPWVGANNVAQNTAGLLSQYQTGTTNTSGGFLGDLMLAAAANASSFAGGGG